MLDGKLSNRGPTPPLPLTTRVRKVCTTTRQHRPRTVPEVTCGAPRTREDVGARLLLTGSTSRKPRRPGLRNRSPTCLNITAEFRESYLFRWRTETAEAVLHPYLSHGVTGRSRSGFLVARILQLGDCAGAHGSVKRHGEAGASNGKLLGMSFEGAWLGLVGF